MIKKIFAVCTVLWLFGCPFLQAEETQVSEGKFPVGERMLYSIKYMGLTIGKSEGLVKEIVSINHRQAYHIVVRVKSNPILDVIYKLRGEHQTYIDVEKLRPLRYEVRTNGEEPDYILHFDHERKKIEYVFKKTKKTYTMQPGSQDQVSLAYVFRTLSLKPDQQFTLPLHADSRQWKIEFKTNGNKTARFQKRDVKVIEVEPKLDFINALVRKGRVTGLVTSDSRRIPLEMRVKVPFFGTLKAELIRYTTDPSDKGGFK